MISLSTIAFKDIVQILVLAFVIYKIYGLFRSTRSSHMVVGMVLLYAAFWIFASLLHLEVLSWIIRQLLLYIVFIFIVIFQPEIRQFLAAFGRRLNKFEWTKLISGKTNGSLEYVNGLMETFRWLIDNGYGALIVIEQVDDVTKHLVSECKRLDVPFVPSLVKTIFYPGTPLHDGGLILNGKNIKSAGCFFPLSEKDISRGTRHRAALGLSEITDAFIFVVSEERRDVSVAHNGEIQYGVVSLNGGFNELRKQLEEALQKEKIGDIVSGAIDDVVAEEKRGGLND